MSGVSARERLITQAFKSACMAELEALKPGNVHIFADGHGMKVQDFIRSAEVAALPIAKTESTVGERILHAVEATYQVVGCNTNLGIILLTAPLIQAAYLDASIPFRTRISMVLKSLTQQDALNAFRAITIASPAGLGESERHDVNEPPQCTLLDAMAEASEKDYVAKQYANDYQDIWLGIDCYRRLLKRWQRPGWATTGLYLHFLANYADSHVSRKYDGQVAESLKEQAMQHQEAFLMCENPKTYMTELLRWDTELKSQATNPGTTADLTVVTLLLYEFLNKLEINSSEVS